MKKTFFSKYLLITLMLPALLISCNKDLPVGPKDKLLNTETFADILQAKLNDACTGYTFIISYKTDAKSIRSGGEARRGQDAPWKPMTFLIDFSIASVSKTITAAAFFKSIQGKRDVTENSLIWPYLPKHWKLGNGINMITFKQLLTHTSGFRESPIGIGNDYAHLKELIANGVKPIEKVYSYNNRNFSIFRLLIPVLAGYDIPVVPAGTTNPVILTSIESAHSVIYANDYIDYCRKNIFSKINLPQAACDYAPDSDPGLYYAFPLNFANGIKKVDNSLYAGGEGWVLNTAAMSEFFRTLHYTEKILPTVTTDKMRNELLGYDKSGKANGVPYYWKNGVYNTGAAGYRSIIIGFGNDIQVSAMVNSKIDIQNTVISAFQQWYK